MFLRSGEGRWRLAKRRLLKTGSRKGCRCKRRRPDDFAAGGSWWGDMAMGRSIIEGKVGMSGERARMGAVENEGKIDRSEMYRGEIGNDILVFLAFSF